MTNHRPDRSRRLLALGAAALLSMSALGACGSSDGSDSGGTTDTSCAPFEGSPATGPASDSTLVGDRDADAPIGGAGGANESMGDANNSAAGDAPDPSIGGSDEGDRSTGFGDTGSGGATRTC